MSTDFKGAKRVSNGLKGSSGVLSGPKKLLLTFEPLSKHFHVGDHLSCNSHQHLLVLPFCNKSSNKSRVSYFNVYTDQLSFRI